MATQMNRARKRKLGSCSLACIVGGEPGREEKKSGVANDLVGELRELNGLAWEGQKGTVR